MKERSKPLLRRIAEEVLGSEYAGKVWKRIEIIGDIAVIRKPFNLDVDSLRPLAEKILEMVPHVKSVWCAVGEVSGEYRVREYVHLAGEKRSETIYKELGCLFKLDIRKVYVSPRLNYEHRRVMMQVSSGEVVVNMFAGVGLFSIIIAKHRSPRKVYSIDINPDAYRYMVENIRLNKLEGVVIPLLGDAARVVKNQLIGVADRVLMPLPGLSYEYLEYAILSLKPGYPRYIHVYEFITAMKGEDPIRKVEERFTGKLSRLSINHRVMFKRVVRTVGPRKYQVVLDIVVERPEEFAVE